MIRTTLLEAYRCLELSPDAQQLQVERTYRRKRALYAEESLATYSLFDETGRRNHLARIEEAYRQICNEAVTPRSLVAENLPGGRNLPVDVELSPGKYLRSRREAGGVTLREIAERTKIGTRRLMQIEEEQFHLLPAPVYLRGFLLAYARALGLSDAESLSARYLECCLEAVGEP